MTAEPVYPLGQVIPHPRSDKKVRVQDADRILEFTGYMLHRVSTEVAHKPQWLEIEAWKITDGTCRYLLHFTGKSVAVHKSGSDCNTGVPTPFSQLPEDAEPCRKCRPSFSNAKVDDIFEAETDRHKVEICDGRPRDEQGQLILGNNNEPLPVTDQEAGWRASGQELVRTLRESWHRPPGKAGTLSAPAQRLVDTLAKMDPAIQAAVQVVEPI